MLYMSSSRRRQPERPRTADSLLSALRADIGHDASTCNSGLGQLAYASSQQAASQCSTASIAHTVLRVAAAVLGVGCLGAGADLFRR
jgi:hypothetical protein